jgi:hypothetical protein
LSPGLKTKQGQKKNQCEPIFIKNRENRKNQTIAVQNLISKIGGKRNQLDQLIG